MNISSFRPRLLGSSVLLAAAIAISATVPALAADSVTQTITAGNIAASVATLGLTNIAYSHSQQIPTGSMTLTADDSTGSGAGWNVTILTSAFVYSGANSGTNIPAANFALTSAADPVQFAGQAVDTLATPPGGPKVPSLSPVGALNTARKVVQALAAYGQGTYTQALPVSLTVPAQSRAGLYTGTLITTISTAP